MNIRLTIMLVFVLALFGGTFLWFQFNPNQERIPNQPWLYKIDDSSIVHIEVSNGGLTVNYDKKPGGTTWYIQDEGEETEVLIEKWSGTPLLLSGPQVNRVLAKSFDNPAAYGLDPPASVIKVTERTGIVYEFHMGDPTPDGENQYARLVGDPQLFSVPQIWAQVINRLALEPPYVRLYYVALSNSIDAIGVEHNDLYVEYHRQLGGQEWTITGDSESSVASDLWQEILPSLTVPPIAQILSDTIDSPADYGLEEPQTRVEIATREERPYIFHLGNTTTDGENRYAQRRGRQELFTVPETWAKMVEGLALEPPYPPQEGQKTDSG
ncbi:MAG: DUF4340 domain-containing protein [Chloroflexi bacterium]|nr:DUF4340 domain-containing protein [Chloroflexota bacterium]